MHAIWSIDTTSSSGNRGYTSAVIPRSVKLHETVWHTRKWDKFFLEDAELIRAMWEPAQLCDAETRKIKGPVPLTLPRKFLGILN